MDGNWEIEEEDDNLNNSSCQGIDKSHAPQLIVVTIQWWPLLMSDRVTFPWTISQTPNLTVAALRELPSKEVVSPIAPHHLFL